MTTKSDTQEVIAANVRRLRGDRSYRDVAAACSTPDWTCYPATIQQIESCRHLPNALIMQRLAVAFGCTVDDLYSEP